VSSRRLGQGMNIRRLPWPKARPIEFAMILCGVARYAPIRQICPGSPKITSCSTAIPIAGAPATRGAPRVIPARLAVLVASTIIKGVPANAKGIASRALESRLRHEGAYDNAKLVTGDVACGTGVARRTTMSGAVGLGRLDTIDRNASV